MPQTEALILTLKQTLKAHHLTYADVAQRLGMSEANVKRMFAAKRFTLERLEEVCRLMNLELYDLFRIYDETRQRITQLTLEQEQELVGNLKLLLIALSVRNRMSYDEMINYFTISPTECTRHLARLDKLKIIDLLPYNRIKLRIDDNFHWLPNGPIEAFFEKQVQSQFLKSRFKGEMDQRLFLYGLLSEDSTQVLLNKMQLLASEFSEMLRKDAHLPLDKRHNIGFLLAMRPWDFDVFKPLLKPKGKSG